MGAILVLLSPALGEDLYFTGQREGALHCLGSCGSCHAALKHLPTGRGEASRQHTDVGSASRGQVDSWLAAPEVCDGLMMFPVDLQREAWSLAALPSEDYLSYRHARQETRRAVQHCESLQLLSIFAWQGALRALELCEEDEACLATARTSALDALLRRKELPQHERQGNEVLEVVVGRNDTVLWTQRAQWALAQAQESLDLVELALDLGRTARLVMEHSRTIWGLKQLVLELSGVYPNIQLPTYRIHPFYGRHFDVLEALLASLEDGSALRMAELGVACGPIGLFLLQRFPTLRYFGADPTIKEEVKEAYKPFADRAQLFTLTSEEMHQRLDQELDFVFIDGPHTYANVRNDLRLWEPRVRRGGIIAGHDFTVRHPPLLWAVSEYRMTQDGEFINLAMDGIWWWHIT